MKWKEIANSSDIICYQKKKNGIAVRIEARANDDGNWEVYKIYRNQAQCLHIDEYNTNSKAHAEELIGRLKYEREITKKELLSSSKKKMPNEIRIKIKRAYKEPFVEKWILDIDNMKNSGIVIIRYCDGIEMDIILNNRFEKSEKAILNELNSSFGIKTTYDELLQNIYYFNKSLSYKSGFKDLDKIIFGKLKNP